MAKKIKNKKIGDAIQKEIHKLTENLIGISLVIDQNFTSKHIKRTKNGSITIIEPNIKNFDSRIIFDEKLLYSEMYKQLLLNKFFTLKLVDGALLTLYYEVDDRGNILSHRLAFFPSTVLVSLEEDEGKDLSEMIYADIVSRNIYPFPIRLDFDNENAQDDTHPASHLTLGQYKNCRIPVSAPVTPRQFINFILKNFYNTFYNEKIKDTDSLKPELNRFDETITKNEKENLSHFVIN